MSASLQSLPRGVALRSGPLLRYPADVAPFCAVAEAFGVPVSPHNYSSGVCSAATLHLMAATPGTGPLEWDTVGSSIVPELFVEPPVVRDGFVQVPQLPGLGGHLTDEVRAQYAM